MAVIILVRDGVEIGWVAGVREPAPTVIVYGCTNAYIKQKEVIYHNPPDQCEVFYQYAGDVESLRYNGLFTSERRPR